MVVPALMTIVGAAAGTDFIVNAANAGTADTANLTNFTRVENLTGGAAVDTFTFNAVLTGTASGLGEDDIFSINDDGNVLQSINGGAGLDDEVSYAARTLGVTVAVDTFTGIESLVGSGQVGQEDTLKGTLGADTFTVDNAVQDSGVAGGVDFLELRESRWSGWQ